MEVEKQATDDDTTILLHLGAAAAVDKGYCNARAWHTEWLRSLLDSIEDHAVEGEAALGRQLMDESAGPGEATVSAVGLEHASRQVRGGCTMSGSHTLQPP